MGKLVLFLFIAGFGFAQFNKVDTKGKKQGEWQKTYPESKALEYKGQFKDDRPIGTFYYFYPSTKTKAIVVHDANSKRSSATFYHESGVVLSIGIYIDLKKDSVWSYYGPSGKISYKETFKKGKLNGTKTIFYVPENIADKSIRVAMVENYLDDVKHGDEIEYFEDGSVKGTCKFENGKRVGVHQRNHPNGKRMTLEYYKYGVLHGFSYGYDESGKLLGKRYFKKGKELRGKELEKWLKYCKDNKIDPLY